MFGKKLTVGLLLLAMLCVFSSVAVQSGEHPWDVDQRNPNRLTGGTVDTIRRNDSVFAGGRAPSQPGQRGTAMTRFVVSLTGKLVKFIYSANARADR